MIGFCRRRGKGVCVCLRRLFVPALPMHLSGDRPRRTGRCGASCPVLVGVGRGASEALPEELALSSHPRGAAAI